MPSSLLNSPQIPLLCLNGKKSESLYQLGLSESKNYLPNLQMLEHLVQTQNPALNRLLRSLGEKLLKHAKRQSKSLEYMRAYAEGLDCPFEKIALAYFLPELASSLSKWIPGLPINLLGCSSFLTWSEVCEAPFHARILDFPLVGSFDTHERVLHTRFDGELAVCSLSSSGMPFHSLTAMNEAGVTMALHQKFTPSFHPDGESIFSLASDLISKVTSYQSLQKLIKDKKSITTWNLIFTFPDAQACSIDLNGNKISERKFNLKEQNQYLCNFAQEKWQNEQLHLPLGINAYNLMREHSGQAKLQKFDPSKTDEKSLLKLMTTLKLKKGVSAKNFELDCLTPSSLHAVVMNGRKSLMLANSGAAPKFFRSQYALIEANLPTPRQRPTLKVVGKLKTPNVSERGYRHLIDAQVCYDSLNKHGFYHHLQMAIASFDELEIKVISEFFLNTALFLDTTHIKERNMILAQFQRLHPLLPDYLQQLCSLFIWRLEKLTQSKPTIAIAEIKHDGLRKMALAEEKMPLSVLYTLLRSTAVIRLDLLDVIHPHLRLGS